VPFIVNRGLSYFNDSILFANEMNQRAFLPHKMQYDFLKHCIRPRKRFSKWAKKSDDSEYIKCIMDEYSYSAEKARTVFGLFTQTQLTQLKNKRDVGGNTRKSN
jgi:preprotein translocase subunit Sss1